MAERTPRSTPPGRKGLPGGGRGCAPAERWWVMARREALLRISKSLLTRRAELRKRLGVELDDLGLNTPTATGDSADAAFDHTGDELASHLAEVEAKELAQVERA